MGKIEVVVLRCEAEQAVGEGPRALASAVKASAKAPSSKGPSAKAPSAGKPATAVSEGLGGLFGIFDGACDFGLDGAGDPMPGTFPEFDMKGRRLDPVSEIYRWQPESPTSNGASYSPSESSGYIDELHNLDGPRHNHPGVVLDRYGQPYAQRVPYYNTSAARIPREDNRGRRSPAVGYVQGGAMSAPPPGRGEQVLGYAPDGTPLIARPIQHQPQELPMRGQRENPNVLVGPGGRQYVEILDPPQPQKVMIGPDGQQYIAVSGQQQPRAHAPRAATVPAVQRQTYASPRGDDQLLENNHATLDYSSVPEGFVLVIDHKTGELRLVPPDVAHKYVRFQQQQQHETPDDQQRYNGDTEHQRSIIFKIGHKLTRIFGHDYRLIAAAVPHLPFFKKYNLANCSLENLGELQRQLNQVLSHRHFPNGEKIVRLHDPRDDEVPDSKTPTKKRPAAPEVTKEKAPRQQAAYNDTAMNLSWIEKAATEYANRGHAARDIATEKAAQRQAAYADIPQDHEWIDKAAGEYAEINKVWREERHKAKEERKERHEERHKKREEKDELKKKDEVDRHSSNHSESTLSHWSSTNTSQRESQKDKIESQNDKKAETVKSNHSGSGGWGATLEISKEATGDWDNDDANNNEPPEPDNQPDNQYQTADPTPTPPTDGHNDRAPSKVPTRHSHAQSSRRSHSPPRSTTTSRTIDPNAAIQLYFDVLHPKPKSNAHQTPIPRTPYLYPPTQAPHLSSATLGNRSHGVRAGKGAEYTHATLRPKYLDTMERPYAVFVFEYRSVEKLGEILGRRGEDLRGDMDGVQEEVGMGVLMGLPKQKLVEEVMRARENAGPGGGAGRGAGGDEAAAAAAAAPAFSPPVQEMQASTRKVDDWTPTQQPFYGTAPTPAAAPPVEPTTHSHQNRSCKSENRIQANEQEDKPFSLAKGWSVKDEQSTGGGGFKPAPEGNPGAKW